ncbi:hypothetical protein FRC09_014114 [Ceratobasidium sp. 395]|nr:hypothetical protein FRC09_014114 [Ceratobasidium sp. 395]
MESSPQDVKPDVATLSLLDGAKQDEEFNFLDGNVYLRVENRIFFVHQYKLLKFRKLEEMLRIHDEIVLSGGAIDFLTVLRLLYVSPFDSLTRFNPDTPALISALQVATTYDYHELRIFAINQLELKALPPLEYLPLACEFGIAGWKDKALDHLVSRDEPITETEAELLGTKAFVAAVVRREQRLAQKNKTLQPQDSTLRLPSDHPHEPVASGHSPAGHSSSDEIPEAPLASNTTLQMNSRGATPLAPDASSDHSRTRSNGISDNLQKGIPGARVLSPVILSTKQVKSWNHAQATQRNQRYGKMRKVSTGSSDEENNEELKQVPHATTSDMVSEMKCKPDSQTIGRWIFPLNKRKQEHQLGIVKNCLFDNTLISLTAGSDNTLISLTAGSDKTFIAGCVMLNCM